MKEQERIVLSPVQAAGTSADGRAETQHRLTVVAPTRNEAANVPVLLAELAQALSGIDAEVIFVDDSDDDTPDVIRAAATRHEALTVDVVHRRAGCRRGGLATAVVEGLRRARSPWVCVMDADLQHPPALVPALLAAAERENASLVVASRYCAGGDNGGLSSRTRVLVSRATSMTSKLLFPRALHDISDPMSGFFLVARDAVDVDALEPEGFKILLEIAARTAGLRVVEVPCAFAPRHAGETKANVREGLRFARHVARLRVKTARRRGRDGEHLYDIHGLVGVRSRGLLPELEQFRVTQLEAPDIKVEIGELSSTAPTNGGPTGKDPFTFATRYAELGNIGFGADIEVNGKVDVRTTRLVGRSPHVLYTNVVEPIMRWRVVERGYALIHGACVVDGDKAYLITARTDTGKTTTMLKLLDRWPYKFVSDDLTLVSPDGEVLPYPKPLTISSHTLHAVKRSQLTRRERLTLPLQSRLHSRSGRRFAFILTKLHVPAASLNALVQFLIPPPKYHVERLVPGVSVAKSAKLAGMIVIQRGPNDLEWLSGGDALDILLANTEDAYGFPPYHAIETFMLGASTVNLRTTERQIVAGALEDVPAVLLTRDERDWASHIPSLIDIFSSRDRINEQSGRQRGSRSTSG